MDVTAVIDAVAGEYDVLPAEITSRTRRQPVAVARQVVAYLLRTTTDATLCEIGAALSRHHATVLHAVSVIECQRIHDRDLNARIRRLTAQVTK